MGCKIQTEVARKAAPGKARKVNRERGTHTAHNPGKRAHGAGS